MINGVLVTFLVDSGRYAWTATQVGWLIGAPVLTGSVLRLPVGVLTDRYGGRRIFTAVMLLAALPLYGLGYADSYLQFLMISLAFGLSGASFSVGIAYCSVWYPRERQGTALGIFGAGNAGAAITSMLAPTILRHLTQDGADLEAWRWLPKLYALVLAATAVIFFVLTTERCADPGVTRSLSQRLAPLRYIRVWRFGLYYFLVFGCFVALAQWLIPYYVNVYAMSIASAGLLASVFSLPSGVIRALGGWMSDRWGARCVMYWVLGICLVGCVMLIVPRMDIHSPGQGVMARKAGTVTAVEREAIIVGNERYPLLTSDSQAFEARRTQHLIWPTSSTWQEPIVQPGQQVVKRQLLARGITHIYFQANIWIFTALVFIVGIAMGIGKAAVYRHIPDYFPNEVGVVGGIVGVLGGLGGFIGPILFGYLIAWTGIWTTCWMFLALISAISLVWMHLVIQQMQRAAQPELSLRIDSTPAPTSLAATDTTSS
jgi:NNP family nitrate/nitrite transporter-like MFS transporter